MARPFQVRTADGGGVLLRVNVQGPYPQPVHWSPVHNTGTQRGGLPIDLSTPSLCTEESAGTGVRVVDGRCGSLGGAAALVRQLRRHGPGEQWSRPTTGRWHVSL